MLTGRSKAGAVLVVWLVAAANPVSAQQTGQFGENAFDLSAPQEEPAAPPRETGSRLGTPAQEGEVAPGTEKKQQEWQGPRVELGYARYRLSDGHGGGVVQGFDFGGYLPTGAARLGMYGELAVRDYSLGQTQDAIVRGALVAGYQQYKGLGPVVPYLVVVGTGGVMFGKRYHTPESYTLWGAGLELGADVQLVRHLWAGASFSWLRITMRGLHWDLLLLRLRMGL